MDIKQSPSGKIVDSARGYKAFVPHALPPSLEWSNRLVAALSRADFLLGKLAREGSSLPNPELLMRPFVACEAVLSSKIEGTCTTVSEVLANHAGIKTKQNPDDLQEVQNYIIALEYGVKRLQEFPLSLRLIKELHEHLMQGVRGAHATPGEFRRSQNWIGPPGCTINTAKFVPPPVEYLMDCLSELEKFLHNRQLPHLIHVALCHYQFEAIHPFLDGNGRMGRLLIILLLIEKKVLPSSILYLSAFFEATRDEYYRLLYSVSAEGTWEDWLIYFLNGVAIQSEDLLSRVERIGLLIDKWQTKVAVSESHVVITIVKQLAVNPYVTIKKISEELGIAYTTAQRGVQKLESYGIIKQVNEAKRDKVYCAFEILAILEERSKIKGNFDG